MGDDRPPGEDAVPPRLSPALRRLLAGYGDTADRVRAAEAGYRDPAASTAVLPRAGTRRAAQTAMAEAFERLAEAVVDLQESYAAVRSQADAEGLPSAAMLTLDEALAIAGRGCAGYLTARTYEQVREAAGRRPLPA